MRRHRQTPSLIKAEQSVLCLLKEDRFEEFSQDPLDIQDPIMGPMGFVIHDIYQINCHMEKEKKKWPLAKTNPHIIFMFLEDKVGKVHLKRKIKLPAI